MNTIITFNNLQELVDFIQPNTYDYVYVSLGSKMNESYTSFSYPTKNNRLPSNAEYQMIPEFVRLQPDTNKILSLVIEDFHNSTLHKWNVQHMQNTFENACILVIDMFVSNMHLISNLFWRIVEMCGVPGGAPELEHRWL